MTDSGFYVYFWRLHLGGRVWLENEKGQTRGEDGSKLGNLEQNYFLNDP